MLTFTMRLTTALIFACSAFAPAALAECYKPSGHVAEVVWIGGHADRPLHKGCPPSVGKVIGNYCYTCDGVGILDTATKWCHGGCKSGFIWKSAIKSCCRLLPPVLQH
jgi:hypothetical protein